MHHRIALFALCGALALSGMACKPKDGESPAAPPNAPAPPGDSLSPPPLPVTAPIHYHCDGLDFTAQFDSGNVTLLAPGKEYVLPQVTAASGAKYESDKAMFWSKGGEALLQIDGKQYQGCREASAAEAPPGP